MGAWMGQHPDHFGEHQRKLELKGHQEPLAGEGGDFLDF